MDKSWMYLAPRASPQYADGVEYFLNFAFDKSSRYGRILCPCIDCQSMSYFKREEVYDHLICSGFQKGYSCWIYHGEVIEASSSSIRQDADAHFQHDIHGLLGDLFPTIPMENNVDMCGSEGHVGLNSDPIAENDRRKIDDLLKDVEQQVYPGSKYNKLSSIVHLYHLKCLNGWSTKSLSMLLEFIQDLLPEGNLLPKTTHQVKRILANLGLGYEKIHACPNGCMLFWEGNNNEQACSICGASRWKPATNNPNDEVGPQKNKAANILRWFPLKPRLQRLFMSSKTASLMKWHHLERKKDGKLRHPADALAWNDFDEKYPEFASDPRNVRLALSSDGFNPFRTMNVSYSIWPVFVIPYNLPPWYVMKRSNFILSLIIPGPKGPGNKIDVYMQPMIKELKELWDVGVDTFDVAANKNFQLKAAVLSTISDFPGYANLSGWSTKGEYACPVWAFDKSSKWLDHGRKWCYMGHRRWLQLDHCEKFNEWFKKRVVSLEEQMDPRVTEEIKWLARGPNNFVRRYSGYLVKGYRFHTKTHDKWLKSQNSGVVVTVMGTSHLDGVVHYYGLLKEIVELNYSGKLRVVLFKCDWVDINRGCKRDEFGVTLVNFSHVTHSGANLLDDPFVLASQVDKVFYAQDPKSKGWFVVRHVKVRDAFNMGCNGDQTSLYSIPSTFNVPNLHRIGTDIDDGIDVTQFVEAEDDDDPF